jgi:hypothetical protein
VATTDEQIRDYIASQPEPKRSDMEELHRSVQRLMPGARLWFLSGKDETGKTVSNPRVATTQSRSLEVM